MIITSSKIITCRSHSKSIDNGVVIISKGVIQAVGTAASIKHQLPGHRIIALQNAVLMPGLVNTHAHIELPPLLNDIRAQTFADWVLNLIRVKKDLSRKDYAVATRKNINTLVQSGTTTVGEICTHGVSPDLLKQSGLRAVVFREIINMTSGVKGQGAGIQLPLWTDSALIKFGLSPHTPHTVSESALRAIHQLSHNKNIRLAMHIAESKDEVQLLKRRKSGLEQLYQFAGWNLDWAPKGPSTFEYLQRIGFLSPALLAVHAVQVNDKDIAIIKKNNVSIAHCPRSNKKLGVGRMSLKKFLNAGITVGLGTDSLASSPNLSMWDEMRYAYHIHRRDGVTPRDIITLATISGAKALGLEKETGALEKEKKADIIAVPLPNKNTGDLYSDLLRETKSCIMTMVNGKILYHEEPPFTSK